MDVDSPLPLFDLARIASDRGDVERGLALLRRAGAGSDHPLAELLEPYRSEPRPDIGRNEPCWCGSGRKYKKCHLGHEQLPLADRASWLYMKACQHAVLTGWNGLLTEVAYERGHYTDPDHGESDELADPLLMDAVLFEGGAFAEFLQMRGSLLPDDERLLAEQWLLVERSVFEVEHVHPGHGVTVRDVRTGDTHELRERAGSRHPQARAACLRTRGARGRHHAVLRRAGTGRAFRRDRLIDLLDHRARRGGTGGVPEPPIRPAHADQYRG